MVERRPWRGIDADLFRFTTTDLRDLHVAVMAAFERAAVLAPALNLDAVRAALAATGWDEPLDDAGLQQTLTSLDEALDLELFPSEAQAALWATTQRQAGARGGTARHRSRLEQAVAILDELPADGVSLAVLADKHTGDPHALDRGRSLAAIVLDAIAIASALRKPKDAEDVRATWELAGVVPDQLSSTVLVLGLPGDDETPAGRWLAAAGAAGEPVVLTLSTLRRWPRPALPRASCAYVFENPSVIAEATRHRWSGPPLICSSGRPTVAVVTLLRQLGAAGATLYQHADLDPAGLAITDWLRERAGTTPWQMDGTGSNRIYEEGLLDELLTAIGSP